MPRKMTTIDEAANAADWYQKMALAMRARDNCLNAIARWQGKLAEAEQHIADLAGQVQGEPEQRAAIGVLVGTEPTSDTAGGLDPNYADSAE